MTVHFICYTTNNMGTSHQLQELICRHIQNRGECLRLCKEKMDTKNVYLTNPAFDKQPVPAPQPRGNG